MAIANALTNTENNTIRVDNAESILDISRGTVSGMTTVNKFGRAENGIQTTATDIWDRADATPTQQIWTAPTTARLHDVASSSDLDGKTASPSSVGTRTIKVYGLTGWDASEVSETITMNGTTNVTTVNTYVIIHRMKVITHGTSGPNVGNITATAQTDATVTAQISIGEGQTLMAIYGIPSTQTAYMTNYLVGSHNFISKNTVTETDFTLLVNEHPDVDETSAAFLNKSNVGIINQGTSSVPRVYLPYFKITGPAIIKFQGISTEPDTEGTAEFDLIVIDN